MRHKNTRGDKCIMINSLTKIERFDDLMEPLMIIDINSHKIVHCNAICHRLNIIGEANDAYDLGNHIFSDVQYDTVEKSIREKQEELLIEDVRIVTPERVEVRGSMKIGNVDKDWNQIYLMFLFNPDSFRLTMLKNKCYDMVYSLSYSYPFRLDTKERTIYFFGPIVEQFGLEPIIRNYPESVIESGVLHGEDLTSFKSMVEKMYRGEEPSDMFRAASSDGTILWYTVEYVVVRNENDEIVEVIGEFVNIQEKKELEEQLYTDSLTGCLNKISFETAVKKKLLEVENAEKYALLIVDLDNFKAINDNLGHLFGDLVLRETGEKLRNLFRSEDYVGRIGGDEFMILMKNAGDLSIVEERAQEIIDELDNTYGGDVQKYRTTASIGIATYPLDGEGFERLYTLADVALYDVKSRGKNGYTFYNSTMSEGTMVNTTPFDVAARASSEFFDQQIIIDIFGLLSEAKDYDASVNKALELLGRRFGVGRSYIFEYNQEDNKYMDNTYEWCAPGVTAERENLQGVPQAVYGPCIERSNEVGIFYCNNLEEFQGEATFDIMREQGIQSFLFSFNLEGDTVVNMVGFDDCTSQRVWSPVEIGTLMHASKILNQFLKYKQAISEVAKAADERLKVLDELYSFAYITNPETHQMQYVNLSLREAFPEAKIGSICYELLHGGKAPCSNCPMKRMKEQGKEKYRCIMPMRTRNEMMLVNVSAIGEFNGEDSMFFSCSNIDCVDESSFGY